MTPRITAEHKVLLSIEIKQDKPGMRVKDGAMIDTQHMKTQVLVEDGETVVVGGIKEMTHQYEVEHVPFLSNIPLLGRLFQHRAKHSATKELLVFITPKILVVS